MPQDRPDVAELVAWASGQSAPSSPEAIIQPAVQPRPEPRAPQAPPPRTAPTKPTLKVSRTSTTFPKPPASVAAIIAAAVIVALGWAGVHLFWTHRTPDVAVANVSGESSSQNPGAALPLPAQPPAPVQASPSPNSAALREVIPDVSKSAARTIRGHIKVSVRAVVSADGTVSGVSADRSGASGYFRRLAEEAAKKWTFAPTPAGPQRLMQIRFDFTRDGATGHAVPLH
jgi:TonB family protein